MRKRMFAAAVCIALLTAGCSQQQQTASQATSPPANVTGLPLFPGAAVVSAREFHRVVDSSNQSRSLVALPSGSYTGHEIVASTTATQQDLIAWLQQVGAQPPAGLKKSDRAANLTAGGETLQAAAHRYGIDFAAFIGPNGTPNIDAPRRDSPSPPIDIPGVPGSAVPYAPPGFPGGIGPNSRP